MQENKSRFIIKGKKLIYYLNVFRNYLLEKPLLLLSLIGIVIGVPLTLNAIRHDYYALGIKTFVQFNNCQLQTVHDIDLNNPMNNADIATKGLNCLKSIDSQKSDFEFIKDDILDKRELYNFKD